MSPNFFFDSVIFNKDWQAYNMKTRLKKPTQSPAVLFFLLLGKHSLTQAFF